MPRITRQLWLAGVASILAACGGGQGDQPASTAATPGVFNIAAGQRALIAAGWSKTFNISGSCSGTMTVTVGPATTAAIFEGAAALASTVVGATRYTNCSSSAPATETRYFDSNYTPRGYFVQGGNYGVYAAPPVLPATAKVGDTAAVGTINVYTDSSKSVGAGRQDVAYAMEADTATTAVLNLITRSYDAAGILQLTQQDRYRVAADGTLTPLSLDIQYANGSNLHLVGN